MPSYTADALIDRVKLYVSVPSVQPGYNDTKILDLLNQHMQDIVASLLISEREDYLVRGDQDVAMPVATSTNISELVLFPSRAVGNKLREVKFVGINNGSSIINPPKIELEEIDGNVYPFAYRDTPYAYGFITEGDGIRVLNPGGFSGYNLRMYYYQRPSDLVKVSDVAQITAIDTGTFTYTVSSVPSTFSIGTLTDLVRAKPPLRTNAVDQAITNIVGNNITYASLPSTLMQVGDYICLAEQSPVPLIPKECLSYLVQWAVVKILEAQNDQSGLAIATQALLKYESAMMDLLSPRVDGEIEIIGSQNSYL